MLERKFLSSASPRPPALVTKTPPPFAPDDVAGLITALLAETNNTAFFFQLEPTLARLTPAALPRAAEVVRTNNSSRRFTVLQRLLNRWSQSNAPAALAFAQQVADSTERSALNATVLRFWADRDPTTLLQWSAGATNKAVRDEAVLLAVRSLASKDPQAALQHLDEIPAESERQATREMIFLALAERDPAAALRGSPPQVSERELRNMNVPLTKWIQTDAPGAAAWLKELPDDVRRRTLIQTALPVLARLKPEVGLEVLASLPVSEDRRRALGSFAAAWAGTNSAAAFAWAERQPATDRDQALHAVLPYYIASQPAAAAQFLEQEVTRPLARDHACLMAQKLAEKDVEAALTWSKKLPAGQARDNALRCAINARARATPAEAIGLAQTLLDGYARRSTSQEIVSFWMQKDFAEAAAWVTARSTNAALTDVVVSVARQSLERDGVAAQKWVLALPVSEGRSAAARVVSDGLLNKDPNAAIDFIQHLTPEEQSLTLTDSLLDRWVKHDLDKAAQWAEALPEGRLKQRAFGNLAQVTLLTDPARAARFMEQAPADDNGYSLYSANRSTVALRWAETDPAAAAQWAARFTTNRNRTSPLPGILHRWAQTAPADAAKFATNLPATERRTALSSAVSEWARTAPREATLFAAALPAEDRSTALLNALGEWAGTDPNAASAWVRENAPEKQQASLVNALLNRWTLKDYEGAIRWVQSLPPGALRDSAASSLAGDLAPKHPALAAEQIALIENVSKRNLAMENVARRWWNEAPEQAKTWLKTNSLPQQRKDRLLKNWAAGSNY